ncbi:succinyl-diaminopimelate desuccinylase [Cognatishimia sp.]|uniref:succinyl-diaminopimelate desuccinylase n=1 Tax=Cognatishimia sp. TaxID=2211648 RepID=UPI0035148BD7
MTQIDPAKLTADLIRCPSVTPEEGGALQLLGAMLEEAGFSVQRADKAEVSNLVARWGDKAHPKTFGFNGHTDVVPVGDEAAWTVDPFGAEIKDGVLYGRGATDMKSGVAAFVAAAIDLVTETPPDGAILITVTGDEEGPALHGTTAILEHMEQEGEKMSVCLVGEPTCPETMGDMIKIGRRGSMTAWFTFRGKQGHSAYPHRARNPLPAMAKLMDLMASHQLDTGTAHFDASTVAVVTMDTGNAATNVIPAECTSAVNIRFNDAHSGESLTEWMQDLVQQVTDETGIVIEMAVKVSGESFITPPGELSDLVSRAVVAETGVTPELSTTGGTSDARFIKSHCSVVEFGLVGKTMHQVDENVPVEQIHQLKAVYSRVLKDYFA